MTQPRNVRPNVTWFVTRRATRRHFLFSPDHEGKVEQIYWYTTAVIAQRLDVDEEMDRLESHITEVRDTLKTDEPIGRRLDFLMQELNREANTLSSKSSDAAVTRAAVDMKVWIEQMREQVQNIE